MEMWRQGSAGVPSATGRIRCGAPHDRGLLFGVRSLPTQNEIRGKIIRREADTNYARRLRYPDALAHFVAGG